MREKGGDNATGGQSGEWLSRNLPPSLRAKRSNPFRLSPRFFIKKRALDTGGLLRFARNDDPKFGEMPFTRLPLGRKREKILT
jgi:hypothetical protein